jgi:hypothetical protein
MSLINEKENSKKMKNRFMAVLSTILLLSGSQPVMAEGFSTAKSRIYRSLNGSSLNGGWDSRSSLIADASGAEGDIGNDLIPTH